MTGVFSFITYSQTARVLSFGDPFVSVLGDGLSISFLSRVDEVDYGPYTVFPLLFFSFIVRVKYVQEKSVMLFSFTQAHTLEEKPEGMFTEEEMKYNFNFMDAPVFGGNRLKREILEFHLSTDKANMDWKFHPNKTCQLVEEIVRKKFDPVIVKCESIKEEVMGRVGPGHEDQYRLLVVSKKFLDQPQLRVSILHYIKRKWNYGAAK